ncbi:barstar family protein [Dactylosporangium sp. NPDC000521]|uniref:barstar family protein n=1 Tax=Dactylosporangium sp. NPDC000521 TaxID=3363975 RepID=UPI0036A11077
MTLRYCTVTLRDRGWARVVVVTCARQSSAGPVRPVLVSGAWYVSCSGACAARRGQDPLRGRFHRHLAALLDFGPYYGRNLDALWDRLTTDVPRPVHLTWTASRVSRSAMGRTTFDRIERILRAVADQDAARCWTDRFTYDLA